MSAARGQLKCWLVMLHLIGLLISLDLMHLLDLIDSYGIVLQLLQFMSTQYSDFLPNHYNPGSYKLVYIPM